MTRLERMKEDARLLSLEERQDLRRFLTKSINAENDVTPSVSPDEVLRVAEWITGGNILGNRERPNVAARILAADRLRQEGVRYRTVGAALGCDRTSAYHLVHRAEEVRATPGIDPELSRQLKQMNEILPL